MISTKYGRQPNDFVGRTIFSERITISYLSVAMSRNIRIKTQKEIFPIGYKVFTKFLKNDASKTKKLHVTLLSQALNQREFRTEIKRTRNYFLFNTTNTVL